ncbi:hypothetical protein [Rhizobium sp. SL86]|uniref:hypothetical protein n=1 Tax=Rhizobium sp. SL86 TaxID=2995148 RepID=UPI0022767A75|nr:hypothetical protein [Rhizobium sp. SL86]MCY1667587.1 hypothetical protein [Rhizobium sp. SL86]
MSTEVPEILLSHYLKTLKLPTFQREYGIPSARSSRYSSHKNAPTTSNPADMTPSKVDAL